MTDLTDIEKRDLVELEKARAEEKRVGRERIKREAAQMLAMLEFLSGGRGSR